MSRSCFFQLIEAFLNVVVELLFPFPEFGKPVFVRAICQLTEMANFTHFSYLLLLVFLPLYSQAVDGLLLGFL